MVWTKNPLEEGVTQDDIVEAVQLRVIADISIDEEEDWEIDFFAGSYFLFVKTETFDFGKVRGDLMGWSAWLRVPGRRAIEPSRGVML